MATGSMQGSTEATVQPSNHESEPSSRGQHGERPATDWIRSRQGTTPQPDGSRRLGNAGFQAPAPLPTGVRSPTSRERSEGGDLPGNSAPVQSATGNHREGWASCLL